MKFTVSLKKLGAAVLSEPQLNRVLRESFAVAGKYWHRHFRKKHFTQAAYNEYGYKPRTKKYNRRKMKALGHSRPLEFTGETKRTTANFRIDATRNYVKVIMRAPRLNFKRSANAPDLRAEFTKVTEREFEMIKRTMTDDMVKRINRLAGFSNQRIG